MFEKLLPRLAGREVILASGSPRRREILAKLGIPYTVIASSYAEDLGNFRYAGRPKAYVLDICLHKASDVCDKVVEEGRRALIIACDTVVYFDNKIYEKPSSPEEAVSTLCTLNGKEHSVFTGVVLIECGPEEPTIAFKRFCVETKVKFAKLPLTVIKAYVGVGESLDKAGGYGIQGLGGVLISEIQGDYYNVLGLPLQQLTQELLAKYGADIE